MSIHIPKWQGQGSETKSQHLYTSVQPQPALKRNGTKGTLTSAGKGPRPENIYGSNARQQLLMPSQSFLALQQRPSSQIAMQSKYAQKIIG